MARAIVRGVELETRVLGDDGPWLALTPGGRRSHAEIVRLAEAIAARGFRVLLHDRRNTGASEIRIAGEGSEEEIWADDLAELLARVGARRAFLGGFSSGSRLSMLVALRHSALVAGLLLCRVTGGPTAAARLPENYYGQFIRAAEQGGMAAVLATEQYRERIAANPGNRARLEAMDPADYVATMRRWQDLFVAGAHHEVMGVSPGELASIRVPTLVIPGNDRTHSAASGAAAAAGIPGAELHSLGLPEPDRDIIPFTEWGAQEPAIVEAFVGFMRRHG